MESDSPDILFCQSCGMPMEKSGDFGANADGTKSSDYCHICFQAGEFTDPDITLEQMIVRTISFMVKQIGMPRAQAKETADTFISKLKRWQ